MVFALTAQEMGRITFASGMLVFATSLVCPQVSRLCRCCFRSVVVQPGFERLQYTRLQPKRRLGLTSTCWAAQCGRARVGAICRLVEELFS